MVLFTTKFFRKLYHSKFGSVYVNKIVQLMLKSLAKEDSEIQDDDLRGNSVLFVERMGHYDGLSSLYLVPKTGTTIDYWVSQFPDNSFYKGWWIFDHLNYKWAAGIGYVRDMTGNDRHAQVYGNPCIVSGGAGLTLPWRPDSVPSLVSSLDGIENHYRVEDNVDYQVGSTDFSLIAVIYPKTFAKSKKYSNWVIELDGDNDYLDLGARTALWSQSMTKFTVAMWVRMGAAGFEAGEDGPSDYRTFFGVADDPSENDEISFYFLRGDQITGGSADEVYIGSDVTNDGYTTDTHRYSTSPVNKEQWYHVVITYDSTLGSNNFKLYVDSILQSNGDDAPNYPAETIAIDASTKAYIGKYISTDNTEYGGRVKDFRFWSNTTLTQTDVTNLFNGIEGSLGGDCHISMDGGEGTLTRDAATGFDATLVNGPIWVFDTTFIYNSIEEQRIISKRDDSNNRYTLWIGTNGVIEFNVKEGGTDVKSKANVALTLNAWSWIVVTYTTSTNTIKIYINGTDVTTTTTSGTIFNDNQGAAFNTLWIGSSNKNAGLLNAGIYLAGFERGAMNSSEVSNLFTTKGVMDLSNASQVAVVNFCIPQ
jgi:Concanavalin A-like lectin/glucanases superfamily